MILVKTKSFLKIRRSSLLLLSQDAGAGNKFRDSIGLATPLPDLRFDYSSSLPATGSGNDSPANLRSRSSRHLAGSVTRRLTVVVVWSSGHSSRLSDSFAGQRQRTWSIVSSSNSHSEQIPSSSSPMRCLYDLSSFACPVRSRA